jgi:hypothetical protein
MRRPSLTRLGLRIAESLCIVGMWEYSCVMEVTFLRSKLERWMGMIVDLVSVSVTDRISSHVVVHFFLYFSILALKELGSQGPLEDCQL